MIDSSASLREMAEWGVLQGKVFGLEEAMNICLAAGQHELYRAMRVRRNEMRERLAKHDRDARAEMELQRQLSR